VAVSLDDLTDRAPPEAVELARSILEQAIADERWAEQLGPALSQRDTARLLGKTPQAVAQDRRLLRLHQRDGRPVYPVFQFDGRTQRDGVAEVVAALRGVVAPLTVAAWLTAPNRNLDGRSPLEFLRAGARAAVVDAAHRYGAAAA
jgi:hypothetical protein